MRGLPLDDESTPLGPDRLPSPAALELGSDDKQAQGDSTDLPAPPPKNLWSLGWVGWLEVALTSGINWAVHHQFNNEARPGRKWLVLAISTATLLQIFALTSAIMSFLRLARLCLGINPGDKLSAAGWTAGWTAAAAGALAWRAALDRE